MRGHYGRPSVGQADLEKTLEYMMRQIGAVDADVKAVQRDLEETKRFAHTDRTLGAVTLGVTALTLFSILGMRYA